MHIHIYVAYVLARKKTGSQPVRPADQACLTRHGIPCIGYSGVMLLYAYCSMLMFSLLLAGLWPVACGMDRGRGRGRDRVRDRG